MFYIMLRIIKCPATDFSSFFINFVMYKQRAFTRLKM